MSNINDKFIEFLNSLVGNGTDKMITQVDLLQKVNCTPVSMSRYLNKKREIPVQTLFEIKKALNISDEVFMQFYGEYSSNQVGNDAYSELYMKFLKLNEDNKNKLLGYVDGLLSQQSDDIQKKRRL